MSEPHDFGVMLPEKAVEALSLDDDDKVRVSRKDKSRRLYVTTSIPHAYFLMRLAEDRAAPTVRGEGYVQDRGWRPACRVAAARIREALLLVDPDQREDTERG